MDQSNQLYLFMLLITTLFTDIKSTGDFAHTWFDAQNQCLGPGLTIEKNKSNQPYWTGVYRRLTPWISILGCYSDFIESLEDVVKKTMIRSSVGMCQEMCHHEYGGQFAVKMNSCLCITGVRLSLYQLSPYDCNYECEDNPDDINSVDCGGERAFNVYEIQRVEFNSAEACLSLECAYEETRFIPQECSKPLQYVCENMNIGYYSSWSRSMEQCKRSHPAYYLLGAVSLSYPQFTCFHLNHRFPVVWIGVIRQIYSRIDQGWEIKEEQIEKFLDCQMCTNNECQFIRCSELLSGSIFCKSTSDTSQNQITKHLTTSHGGFSASNFMPNSSASNKLLVSTSTTGNNDNDLLLLTTEPGASENLVFKISLPPTAGFITLLICVLGVVLYKRRGKMTKTERTTKVEVRFIPEKNVYSELDFSQSNSSFALEHCYHKISKESNSLNESPKEGIIDHLKDKQAQETDGNNVYQNASIDITGYMPAYDTIAECKDQEEEATYNQLYQDANDTYCDLRVYNHSIDNPYDNAV